MDELNDLMPISPAHTTWTFCLIPSMTPILNHIAPADCPEHTILLYVWAWCQQHEPLSLHHPVDCPSIRKKTRRSGF